MLSTSLVVTAVCAVLAVVILAGVWLAERSARRQTADDRSAHAKAVATGHPSAGRRASRQLSRPERESIALELAELLTRAGARLARPLAEHDVEVQVWGEDGVYALHAGSEYVHVQYRTNGGTDHLGQYLATYRAAQCVTVHAGLSPRH